MSNETITLATVFGLAKILQVEPEKLEQAVFHELNTADYVKQMNEARQIRTEEADVRV